MSARLGFPNLAGPAPDAAAPLPIGSQIEAHSVLQVLSEGPNGFVYLTRDANQGATRVLKEFMPRSRLLRLSDGSVRPCDVSDSIATSVARIAFMNEANTLAAFQNAALIRVLGVIPAHRTLYRVMPLVDGVSLEQHCRTRVEPPSLAWLHALVGGLLQALEVLHERRLGHGSVRPEQVMVRESGQPMLLGFASVARELDAVSPTPWQSPGAAHLTRHAPPVPADDLPALAETAFFAATGLPAPTLQQRLEGVPFDLRQALAALAEGPGDAQQHRRGLWLALEAAFATSTHARPQSVAEFRRLLAGDAPARGGRYAPAPRWVGEMPERDRAEVDLLISQPAPLSDDLPPVPRPVTAAPAMAAASPVVELPASPALEPPSVAADAPAMATANVAATVWQPEAAPRAEPADGPVAEAAWPFEPAPRVESQVPVAQGAPERVAEPPPSIEAIPTASVGASEPPFVASVTEPAFDSAPARNVERVNHSRVERDFAATEFLVAAAVPDEVPAPFHASAPDTEPFVASLRPQPAARSRSPYAAMAAMAVLALVGIGIAAWWHVDVGQIGDSSAATAPAPVTVGTPVESPGAPTAASPTTSVAAAAPPSPPAPTTPEAAATPTPSTPSVPAPVPVAVPAPAPAPALEPSVAAATAPTTTPPPPPPPPEVIAAAPARPDRAAATVATPPKSVRPTTTPPQRTTAAPAARTSKPGTGRTNAATARTPVPTAEAARSALRARSPLAACGNRTQFSLVYCMQQQCARPAYQAHPQCADLRNGG